MFLKCKLSIWCIAIVFYLVTRNTAEEEVCGSNFLHAEFILHGGQQQGRRKPTASKELSDGVSGGSSRFACVGQLKPSGDNLTELDAPSRVPSRFYAKEVNIVVTPVSTIGSMSVLWHAMVGLLCYGSQAAFLAIAADCVFRGARKTVGMFSSTETSVAMRSHFCRDLANATLATDLQQVEELLQSKNDAVGVDMTDVWGCTALHVAAPLADSKGRQIASLILQNGAEVDARDMCEETPLHMAARRGTPEMCSLLIAFGAQIDAVNIENKTPLVIAAQEGREDMCVFLLSRGASVGGLPEDDVARLPLFFTDLLEQQAIASAACAERNNVGDDTLDDGCHVES
jgi:hypothetical protein